MKTLDLINKLPLDHALKVRLRDLYSQDHIDLDLRLDLERILWSLYDGILAAELETQAMGQITANAENGRIEKVPIAQMSHDLGKHLDLRLARAADQQEIEDITHTLRTY